MKIRMLDFLNFMIFVIEYLVLPPKQVSLQQLEGFHFQRKDNSSSLQTCELCLQ